MNVLHSYLETMFSPYPETPRLLEAKAELRTMMDDAYAGFLAEGMSENEAVGRVITDFGNLDEVAPVLGISAEIAPGAPHRGTADAADYRAPRHPSITLEEAKAFVETARRTRYRTGVGVALCVISPALIITLPPIASESGVRGLDQNIATAIGLLSLFVFIAIAVLMFIGMSREMKPFTRINEGRFTRNPAVTSWIENLAQKHERSRTFCLQLAVLCWVLSAAPVLLFSLLTQGSPHQYVFSAVGVAMTLVLVAVGLLIFLPANWAHAAAQKLTHGSPQSPDEQETSIVGVIAAIYWPLLTAIFLAWSFIGNAWDRSWIVWPIGAVLFGAIAAGLGAIESYRKAGPRR